MPSTVCFNDTTSEALPVSSGVKQGCGLAPTLFWSFILALLCCAFSDYPVGINLHTRADGKLFNIAKLWAKTQVTEVLIHELLLLEHPLSKPSYTLLLTHTCKELGLTINLKRMNIMVQATDFPPIDGLVVNVVETFTYLGSTVANNLSGDTDEQQERKGSSCSGQVE